MERESSKVSSSRAGATLPLQKWSSFAVGAAGLAYALSSLPKLLHPSGALGALLLLFSGMLLGILLFIGAGVYLFIRLGTVPHPADPEVSPYATAVEVEDGTSADLETLSLTEKQGLYESVVQEMIRNAGKAAPPHTFAMDGRYAGWLWAMPGSNYNRSEALANWPPATEGPKPLATRWWGHLQGKSLLLARTSQLEHSDRVPVVCISLAGCSLELVTEGLRGKTRWWRKAPLELSHPDRRLLGNERSIMLFAAGSAAKEQWYTVLRSAAGVDGGAALASEAMYAQFCERVRAAHGESVYPQAEDASAVDAAGHATDKQASGKVGSPKKGQKGKGGSWGRWWSRGKDKNESPEKTSAGAQKPGAKPELKEKKSRESKSPKKQRKLPEDAPLPGFLSPQQMETAWMGSKKNAPPKPLAKVTSQGSAPPMPDKEREREADRSSKPGRDGSAHSHASADASSPAGPSRAIGPSLEDIVASLPDVPPASSSAPAGSGTAPAGSGTGAARSGTTAAGSRAELHASPSTPSVPPDAIPAQEPESPDHALADAAHLRPARSGPAAAMEPSAAPSLKPHPTAFYEDAVRHSPTNPPAASPAKASPAAAEASHPEISTTLSLPAGIPLGFPTETAVNMLLARVAFDLLRSQDFKAKAQAHVQKKMNELRLPDFIHSIDCLDIDIGSSVPKISNLRALPTPDAVIWPQIMFDLEYEGCVRIMIETKLHVRDHAMWSQLDQAITRVAGAVDESASPVDSDDESSEPAVLGAAKAEPGETSVSAAAAAAAGTMAKSTAEGGPSRRRLMDIGNMRRKFAEGIRQIAEVTADRVARMQLRMQLEIRSIKGPIVAWVPPPPGDRLWFSFVSPPELIAEAQPQVSGRMLKYVAQAGRVSQFIASKLQSSIAKNMLFPSCSDIKLPHLLPADDAAAALALPSFLSALQGRDDEDSSHKGKLKPADSQARVGASPPGTPTSASPSQQPEHVPVARLPKKGSSLQPRRTTADQLHLAQPDSQAAAPEASAALPTATVSQDPGNSAHMPADSAHMPADSSHPGAQPAGKLADLATARPHDSAQAPVDSSPDAIPSTVASAQPVDPLRSSAQPQQDVAAPSQPASGLQILTGRLQKQTEEPVQETSALKLPPQISAEQSSGEESLSDPLGAVSGHLMTPQQQQNQQQQHLPERRRQQQQPEPEERQQLAAAKRPSLPRHSSLPAAAHSQRPAHEPEAADSNGAGQRHAAEASSQQGMTDSGNVGLPGRDSMQSAPHTSADEELALKGLTRQSRSVPSSTDASPAGEAAQKGTWFQKSMREGHKNWETFKTRNPNTVTQGIKLAGQVASWRDQAQERMRTAIQTRESGQAQNDKLTSKQH